MNNDAIFHPKRIGKYELRERLGRGGMAEVWKAYDAQLERFVAIKLLHPDLHADPDFLTRFLREARVIASLHHPNIVKILDFQTFQPNDISNPVACMIMDYIDGPTLADYIRTTSRMGKYPLPGEIVHLFISISRAIDYAHQHGMIHRDIKPANILFDQTNKIQNPMGEPVLTDFGIAKLLGVSTGTDSGSWLGTPLYISPEQALGQMSTERSDIYSLGVILYEICTGVQPFRGENIPSLMMQHVQNAPPSPALINPNIPPALSMVILRALAKDPAARFGSASAMTAAMAEALNVALPTDISQFWMLSEEMSQPTYLSSVQPGNALNATPLLNPTYFPGAAQSANSVPQTALSSPLSVGMAGMRPANPQTPYPTSLTPVQHDSGQQRVASPPPPMTSVDTTPRPPINGTQRRWFVFSLLVVLLVLLGGSLGGFLWLSHQNSGAATPIVGHAYFVSSGQTNEETNLGSNDELLIDIQNVAPPSQGKSYYGWLLGDLSQPLATQPVFLGALQAINGRIHQLYAGDAKHTNLVAAYSRFLVTEEDSGVQPLSPSPDKSTWRYYAQLPQTPDSMDMAHMGALQHIRHLLADAPELLQVHLTGGLDLWLFRNAEKVFEWAGSARDDWERADFGSIRNQIIRILDYLDGKTYVQKDFPGAPNLVNPRIAPVALLQLDPQDQNTPGLLNLVDLHLSALEQAPGIAPENHQLAAQIDQDANLVLSLLKQVRLDGLEVLKMTLPQLQSSGAHDLLDTMETQARNAYIGQVDPQTNTVQGGIVQMHYTIQRLATFDITSI